MQKLLTCLLPLLVCASLFSQDAKPTNKYVTITGWRGANRDARVDALPTSLPPKPIVRWRVDLLRSGLGGIAATKKHVVFGDRDADDLSDVWRCVDAKTGAPIWEVPVVAIGELDYGNSPRTTPLLVERVGDGKSNAGSARAYLLGAMGDLLCVKLATGEVVWQKNLVNDFGAEGERPWGYCGSPLLVSDKLIVNPGAADASIVALDPATGDLIWKCAGGKVGYGSLNVAVLGGKRQIVGHDATSLGGWDVETGKRLWELTPPIEGDFNVPTPLPIDGRLLVTTENNGTRLYAFDDEGRIKPNPVAENKRLKPDMSTPVVIGQQLFCVNRFFYCLDVSKGLAEVSRLRDCGLGDFAAVIASPDRVLVVGKGDVLLVDPAKPQQVVSRWRVFDDNTEVYSHAAVVAGRLYIRGETSLQCLNLTK